MGAEKQRYLLKISGDFKGYRRDDEDRGTDTLTVERIDDGEVTEQQTVNARNPAYLCLKIIDMITGQNQVYGIEYCGDGDRARDFSTSDLGRILHYVVDQHNKTVKALKGLEGLI